MYLFCNIIYLVFLYSTVFGVDTKYNTFVFANIGIYSLKRNTYKLVFREEGVIFNKL